MLKPPNGYAKASGFSGVAFLHLHRSNLPKLCCQRQKFCLYTITGKRIGAKLVSEIWGFIGLARNSFKELIFIFA